MKLTVGVILKLSGEIGDVLTANGVLDAAGDVITPLSVQTISKAVAAIEQLLVSKGVVINGEATKIIQALPLILALIK